MKKVFTFFVSIVVGMIFTINLFAQSPEKMSYQAVIRDADNNLVASQSVSMQISILQGSVSGTAVYTETQTPNTNVNGLVSLEIGSGTTSDDFTIIDWANGPYFIKTETDPEGGTNYTITGTSQLLSVPYALHAKTAKSLSGGINESDPLYTSSPASNVTATDITNLGNLSGVNTGDQDLDGLATETALGDSTALLRSEIPSVSGFLTSESDPVYGSSVASGIMGTDTTNWNNKLDSESDPTVTKYSVGDFAQGGIVFWVDETGQHGLVCAKEDQDGGSGLRWYAGTSGVTRAKGSGLFAGELNTAIIISTQVSIGDDGNDYAAQTCNDLQVTEDDVTYGDWYLPSKEELDLMFQNTATIDATAVANGGSSFTSAAYWSSTEVNSNNAWFQSFSYGDQDYYTKSYTYRVRAVRAF